MVVLNFWRDIGNWFKQFFKDFRNFFLARSEGQLSNLEKIFICIGIIVLAWIMLKLVLLLLRKMLGIKKKGPQIDVSAKTFAVEAIKIFYWLTIALVVNSILGINLSSLAGIASAVTVALGLALQDIIGMFASGLLLLRTKNFVTGDFISVSNSFGTVEGSVHRVGLLYTLLTNPNGQEIIIPNNNVTKSNVVNYTKNPNRRMSVSVPVPYDVDIEKVKAILLDIMMNDERINQVPNPVVFVDNLGEYCMYVMCRCHIPYQYYWDVFNSIKEKIILAFRDNDIKIPVRTSISVNTEGAEERE